MLGVLGVVAALLLAALAGPYVRRRTAERKRLRYDAGEAVRLPVRARGPRPWPRRGAWGSVATDTWPPRFRRWHRLGAAVPLAGLTEVGRRIDADANAVEELVVFRLRDGAGGVVELGIGASQADLLERVLRGMPATGEPAAPPRVPRWRLVAAALATAWLLAWVYFATVGTVLRASVLANDGEGGCDVAWTLGGERHETSVDCFDQRPGDTMPIIALPQPFTGMAVDTVWTRFAVPIIAAPFYLPIALYGIGRLRRRDAVVGGTPVVADRERQRLARHELRYARIAEHVRRRAADEAWELARVPWHLRPLPTPWARLAVPSVTRAVLPPLLLLGGAAVFGLVPVSTALRHDATAARAVTATVESVDSLVPPVPRELLVSFDAGGRTERVRVASLRDADTGDEVRIGYDAAHDTARLLGDADGVARGVLLVAIATTVGLALLLWRVTRLAGVLRGYRRLRARPPAPMRYAALPDPTGRPVLLLFGTGGDPRPSALVPLPYLPRDVPVTGTAGVHGTAADGERLVVRAGEATLYPNAPAAELPTRDLADLVNGDLPDDDEDG